MSASPAAPGACTHLACKTSPGKEPMGQRSFKPGPLPSMPLGLLPPWIRALTSRHLLQEVFPDYPTYKNAHCILFPYPTFLFLQSLYHHLTFTYLFIISPTPTPSQWKLPESGVYTSLIHPQCPEQGLAHSRCLIHLFLE